MEKSLSKAISAALTAAAKEAVDAHVKQVNIAAIDKAVRKQAHELDDVFAAAVDTAIQKQAKKLEQTFAFAVNSAIKQQMGEIAVDLKEAVQAKLAKDVRKTELRAKIREAKTVDYVDSVAGFTFPDIWSFWYEDGDPRRSLARWESEFAELEEAQGEMP